MFIIFADKLISIFALFILSPLLFVIAILVYFDLGSPIIFKQKRVGINGKEFEIYKFRSMKNTKALIVLQAHEEKKRISKFAHILRLSNFDELPQLFNILKGDMSVVGPRPHESSHDIIFSKKIKNYKIRQKVKPGLTGLAQINGYAGPIESNFQIIQRVKYDIYWVKKKNFCLYLLIILKTFFLIFKKN